MKMVKQTIIPNENELQRESEIIFSEDEVVCDDKNYVQTAYMFSKARGKPNEFYDDVLLSLSAGTVNISVLWGFFLLMMGVHPVIQEKVYDELNDIIGSKRTEIGFSDVEKLSYFDQVFKETLRRFTLIPLIFRKLETSIEIDGITIPEETNIAISIAGVHFSSKYWKDPWNFNPDNFDPELSKTRPKYSYLPFAAGPRDCLGKMYAVLEMKVVLASLLREYKFSTEMKMEDIKLNYSFLVSNLSGYNMKIESRKNHLQQ